MNNSKLMSVFPLFLHDILFETIHNICVEVLKFQTIVYNVNDESKLVERYNGPVDLTLAYDPQGLSCKFTTGKN